MFELYYEMVQKSNIVLDANIFYLLFRGLLEARIIFDLSNKNVPQILYKSKQRNNKHHHSLTMSSHIIIEMYLS